MTMTTLAIVVLILAAIPCLLFMVNLLVYRPPPPANPEVGAEKMSVLIPARNEEANIGAILDSVLASRGAEFEVVVLDDQSTDRTSAIVGGYAARDARVRLEKAPALPAGWCGKQHACWALAGLARHPLLVFMDADVRLEPDGLARMARFMEDSGADLASGVPRQELVTFSERLLIPLIHFVLLGFLPMHGMRWSRWTAFGAGCGQLFVARAESYRRCGGHSQIRASLHDGLKLPKAFRRAGLRTDLFDATGVAGCRMYRTNGDVWRGLGRNATEGLAAPAAIVPMTALLLGGQVLPLLMLAAAPWLPSDAVIQVLAAVACMYLPRIIASWRFRQPWESALLHPLGVVALLVIQWQALARSLTGRPAEWRGRTYVATTKLLAVALALSLAASALAAESGAPPAVKQVAGFELSDQHGKEHRYHFPKANLSVLTVADRKGSAQVESWAKPVQERYGTKVDIDGLADMSAVPGFLRGMVAGQFKKQQQYPVMLDWTGQVCRRLGGPKGHVVILLIDREGRVLREWRGRATEGTLRELFAAIDGAKP